MTARWIEFCTFASTANDQDSKVSAVKATSTETFFSCSIAGVVSVARENGIGWPCATQAAECEPVSTITFLRTGTRVYLILPRTVCWVVLKTQSRVRPAYADSSAAQPALVVSPEATA